MDNVQLGEIAAIFAELYKDMRIVYGEYHLYQKDEEDLKNQQPFFPEGKDFFGDAIEINCIPVVASEKDKESALVDSFLQLEPEPENTSCVPVVEPLQDNDLAIIQAFLQDETTPSPAPVEEPDVQIVHVAPPLFSKKPAAPFAAIFKRLNFRSLTLNHLDGQRVRLVAWNYHDLFHVIKGTLETRNLFSISSADQIFAFQCGSAIGVACFASFFEIPLSNIELYEDKFAYVNIRMIAAPFLSKVARDNGATYALKSCTLLPEKIKQQIVFVSTAGISLKARHQLAALINTSEYVRLVVLICSNVAEFKAIVGMFESSNYANEWVGIPHERCTTSGQSLFCGFAVLCNKSS
jgi:hypothetical protein